MQKRLRVILHAALRAVLNTLRGASLLNAQAVAFNLFLAFFPALLFLAGMLAYADPGLEDLLQGLQVVLPPGSRRAVVTSLLELSENPARLLVVGSIGTVMLGSNLMFSLARILTSISHCEDSRGFWRRQFLAFAMVLATVVPWVAVSLLVILGKFVRAWLIERVGVELSRPLELLWTAGYYSLAAITTVLILAALYHFLGPEWRHRWDDVLPGAVVAVVLWWIVTSGFGYYVRRLAIYDAIYGGFAATIGLLIWMYLSAVVILIGAQFNAEWATLRSR